MNALHHWGQLTLDIHLAAKTSAPVLISAPPGCAENVARTITAFSIDWNGKDLLIVDCGGRAGIAQLVADISRMCAADSPGTVLLREVHALPRADQSEVASVVGASCGRPGAPRIISSSSVSLFDRVRSGAFDEQLFYRLNVMHIVIDGERHAPGEA